MKPFNLERAQAGDKMVTRDGREVRFIAYVPEAKPNFKVLVLIEGETYSMWESGNYWDGVQESANDLFMAPKLRTVWVNLFINGNAKHYPTQAEADNLHGKYCIGGKAHKIEVKL